MVKRALLALVLLLVLLQAVSCVPQWAWELLPFGSDAGCGARLDEETLDRLTLSMNPTLEMRPGEERDFSLGVVECCYYFEPVETCTTWSVDPSDGASIDHETGSFSVGPGTPGGEVFTVTADVEDGRRLVSIEVYVYTPEDNPLVGIWREEAQLGCEDYEEVAPEERIGELRFGADGTFSVTWHPFEIYRDYWGMYAFDSKRGALDLWGAEGNYVPDDVDGSGSFLMDEQGRLVLKDMWLGAPHGGSGIANCGHRFTR